MMRVQTPLVISHPERQTSVQRTLFGILTFLIWAVWFYLWLPLVTGVLWLLGIRWGYIQMFLGKRGVNLRGILFLILTAIAMVLYWSSFNRIRYAKLDRRRRVDAVSKAAIGRDFGVTDAAMLGRLRQGRRLDLYFDDVGRLLRVEDGEGDVLQGAGATYGRHAS